MSSKKPPPSSSSSSLQHGKELEDIDISSFCEPSNHKGFLPTFPANTRPHNISSVTPLRSSPSSSSLPIPPKEIVSSRDASHENNIAITIFPEDPEAPSTTTDTTSTSNSTAGLTKEKETRVPVQEVPFLSPSSTTNMGQHPSMAAFFTNSPKPISITPSNIAPSPSGKSSLPPPPTSDTGKQQGDPIDKERTKSKFRAKALKFLFSLITVRLIFVFLFVLQGFIVFISTFTLLWSAGEIASEKIITTREDSLFSLINYKIGGYRQLGPAILHQTRRTVRSFGFDASNHTHWAHWLSGRKLTYQLDDVRSVNATYGFVDINGKMTISFGDNKIGFSSKNQSSHSLHMLDVYSIDTETLQVKNYEGSTPYGSSRDLRDAKWFIDALVERNEGWEDRKSENGYYAVYSFPVIASSCNGSVCGVFFVELDFRVFSLFLYDITSRLNDSLAFIIDKGSWEIVNYYGGSLFQGESPDLSLVVSHLAQHLNKTNMFNSNYRRSGIYEDSMTSSSYRWASTLISKSNDSDWIIVVMSPRTSFSSILSSIGVWSLAICVFMLVLTSITVISITSIITRRLNNVSKELYSISTLSNVIDFNERPKKFSIFYEVRLLEKSIFVLKKGLKSFQKFLPLKLINSIMKFKESHSKRIKKFETIRPQWLYGTPFSEGIVSEAQPGVERRYMSVMFCEVVDFVSIVESYNTEVLLYVMSKYFTVVTEIIEQERGIVDKFIGDGVMAIWNHQYEDVENHEVRACSCALKCVEKMKDINRELLSFGFPAIKLRVGVNSGEALCGNIGSNTRLNFTALGDSINIASRLESLNKMFETNILIGEITYRNPKVRENFLCYFVDSIILKGKNHHVQVYNLRNFREKASKNELEIERMLTIASSKLYESRYEDCREMLRAVKQLVSLEEANYKSRNQTFESVEYVTQLQTRLQSSSLPSYTAIHNFDSDPAYMHWRPSEK